MRRGYAAVFLGLTLAAALTGLAAIPVLADKPAPATLALHASRSNGTKVNAMRAAAAAVSSSSAAQLRLMAPTQFRVRQPTAQILETKRSVAQSAGLVRSSSVINGPRTALTSSGWLGMNNTVNDVEFGCGSRQLCIEPPDPGVAAGTDDVVQTVNLEMRIFDRGGSALLTVPLTNFFGTAGDLGTSDPQIAYHAVSGRWLASIISWDCNSGYLTLAVSDTSDPTGNWTLWRTEYPGALPDFPGLASQMTR